MKNRMVVMMLVLLLPAVALAGPGKRDAEVALAEARSGVESAERAGAAEHASNDLNAARDDLARANGAFEHRDWEDSVMASEKTRADGTLAEARSRQHRAEASTAEVENAVRTLRTELGVKGETP
ncbi:MAG: DUF4398 domain-containing protein [Tahibacter sp.]